MVTDSEPCDTAAGSTRTFEPITTVPVRELTITRAGAFARLDLEVLQRATNAMRCVGSTGACDAHRHRVHRASPCRRRAAR
jgi:hypothetical protein